MLVLLESAPLRSVCNMNQAPWLYFKFSLLCSGQIQCFAVSTSNTAEVEFCKSGQVSAANWDDDHESCLFSSDGACSLCFISSVINIIITGGLV